MTSNISLITSKVLSLELDSSYIEPTMLSCRLKWRQKKLWVEKIRAENGAESAYIWPALKGQSWLSNCLKNSFAQQVCLDPQLGEAEVKKWADACKKAKKEAILRINSDIRLLIPCNRLSWKIKRFCDTVAAGILLLLFSPIILAIALAIKLTSPGEIFFRQWRVGRRGKLFQVYKFRTMIADAEQLHHQVMGEQAGLHKCKEDPRVTLIGKWLRKYSLDELPQLFNVLKGEMSLVGPRPWALYDAFRLSRASRKRLNALPGITGAWQVQARSNLLDLDAVTKCDLDYLYSWSLTQDLKILLLTIPKVISGFGAY